MNANKWNDGKQYEHLFDIGFSVSSDVPWDKLKAADLQAALERRIADLRKSPGEILEAISWSETISYEMENDHE